MKILCAASHHKYERVVRMSRTQKIVTLEGEGDSGDLAASGSFLSMIKNGAIEESPGG
jgi:hypothetical protein